MTAGPPPRYGMWTICVPVRRLNSSPARCPGEPLPTDANCTDPGRSFASLINSATLFAGKLGCATRICGSDATVPTGSKSFAVSNGSFG